jgi:hypothetical protein
MPENPVEADAAAGKENAVSEDPTIMARIISNIA